MMLLNEVYPKAAWSAGLVAMIIVAGTGGGCSQAKVVGDAGAVASPERIPGLIEQADANGAEGLAVLVMALDDDDPAVRMFAVQALRQRSGRALGYRYYDSTDARRAATRRWRDWAETQTPTPDPGISGNDTPGTPAPSPDNNTASALPQ